jgi:Transposase DDE domain group 1
VCGESRTHGSAGGRAEKDPHPRAPRRAAHPTREAKNTGLRNLPCRGFAENTAWLHALLTAIDLVCWTKILGFTDTPALAHAEIVTLRNLVLHVGARITRGARQVRLRIDQTCRYATAIATAWLTIRTAFT